MLGDKVLIDGHNSIKFAMMVISSCAFGVPLPWSDEKENEDGKIPIHKAIRIVSDKIAIRIAAPWIIRKLPIKP